MNKSLISLISIDDRWPTQEDTDKDGKIWVYRPPSMTNWDRTGTLFKIPLDTYAEPLELEIKHFVNFKKEKYSKLDYTNLSRTAHNNRIQWPYWMPGHILMEKFERENNKGVIVSSNFPVVKGHVTKEEYLKAIKK